jgi:tryptophan-rich sensory protein
MNLVKSKNNFFKFIISLALPFLAAFIGSSATFPAIPTWYASLNKPFFSPPNYLFAPVWTLLYLLMGISFYLVWSKGKGKSLRFATNVYLFQLILNTLWSIFFFGNRSPLMGLIIIVILWFMILITILRFYKINRTAGILLIPYILWVSFASVLNLSIFLLNP